MKNRHEAGQSVSETISVVIPAYRSTASLPSLMTRLQETLDKTAYDWEVIIVDDASPDDTWETLKQLKPDYSKLKIARLSRNGGQHNAILCGLGMASGDIVVTMDDDLQNRPEDITLLVNKVAAGYDLAIAAFPEKQHSGLRNMGGRLIDSIQRKIFGLPKNFQLTSFRACRSSVVGHAVSMGGVFPYITAMLLSHTSNYTNVPVQHEPRPYGQSNYTMKRSFLLAFNLLLNYSPLPLYVVIALCGLALVFSVLLAVWVFWQTLAYGTGIQGWASTMAGIAFFNSLTLLSLVVLGLYVSRISQQVTRSRVSFSLGEVIE